MLRVELLVVVVVVAGHFSSFVCGVEGQTRLIFCGNAHKSVSSHYSSLRLLLLLLLNVVVVLDASQSVAKC